LFANLLLDYAGDGNAADPVRFGPIPASTLDDTSRIISLGWNVRPGIVPGCHRFTLRVTHLSNLVKDHSEQAKNKADLAEVFWFANINVDPEDAGTLKDCPSSSSGAQLP